jgi:hypothetical protein
MATPDPPPELDPMLAELAEATMCAVRVVKRALQIEQAALEVAATWLPDPAARQASLTDAIAAAEAMESFTAAISQAVPRLEKLAGAMDRLSRSLRLTVALRRRLQTGWPRANTSDNRAAMQRRQVKRAVGENIKRDAEERDHEDLFAELDEKLLDPGLDDEIQATSVEAVAARICRELRLAAACAPFKRRPTRAHPPDTG